jgi:hydroxymethylglutaryl-CoA lyase
MVPVEAKLRLVNQLVKAGLREIEVTSFVSPKWVPQLADAAELWPQLNDAPGVKFSVLVPNAKGLDRAIELGVPNIAVFTASSDAFTQRNINMTVKESIETFQEIAERYRAAVPEGTIRGYVSTIFECPYAGRMDPEATLNVANQLVEMVGVDEISLGDTIGVGTPSETHALANLMAEEHSGLMENVFWHFHDTRGTALANVAAVLEYEMFGGFDSSAAGLGGCPYAKGAGGNLATDDLVYFLEREGIATGVDPRALAQATEEVLQILGRPSDSKVRRAVMSDVSP